MSFSEFLAEDRRLCILRLLSETGGTANDSVLHTGIEHLGHVRIPRSDIRDDLRFLHDHGLIKIEWFKDVMVATVTKRGIELTEGRIAVDGVKSPSIGD